MFQEFKLSVTLQNGLSRRDNGGQKLTDLDSEIIKCCEKEKEDPPGRQAEWQIKDQHLGAEELEGAREKREFKITQNPWAVVTGKDGDNAKPYGNMELR